MGTSSSDPLTPMASGREFGFRLGRERLALGTVDDELLRLTKPGLAREAEFLKVTVRAGR